MSYPAFFDFFDDPERTVSRICVYMALQPPFLSHAEPRETKVDAVQVRARVSTRSTTDAIAWMIRCGYLVEHSRNPRGVPALTLAWARKSSPVSRIA